MARPEHQRVRSPFESTPVVPWKTSTATSQSAMMLSSIARRSSPFLRRRNTACEAGMCTDGTRSAGTCSASAACARASDSAVQDGSSCRAAPSPTFLPLAACCLLCVRSARRGPAGRPLRCTGEQRHGWFDGVDQTFGGRDPNHALYTHCFYVQWPARSPGPLFGQARRC